MKSGATIPLRTSRGSRRRAPNRPAIAPSGAATSDTTATSSVTVRRTCDGVAPTARSSANSRRRLRSARLTVAATTITTTTINVPE